MATSTNPNLNLSASKPSKAQEGSAPSSLLKEAKDSPQKKSQNPTITNNSKIISNPIATKPKLPNRITPSHYSISHNNALSHETIQEDPKSHRSAGRNNSMSQDREPRRKGSYCLNHVSSKTSLGRPSQNCSTRPGSGYTTSRSPRKYSEFALKRIENERKIHTQSMKLGAEGLDTYLYRKTLEKQVGTLENRLNKLKFEEELMAKKIKETETKTEKILSSKKRHQEDLQMKEWRAKKKEADIERRRMSARRDREESRDGLRKASLDTFKNKYERAYGVKVDNQRNKALKEHINKQIEERNRELISMVQKGSNTSMSIRIDKENKKVEMANKKYETMITNEKGKVDELNEKCKELELLENQMLERLSQSYSIHKAKVMELEKAFTMKVKAE